MIKEPIYRGILQSDLDFAGFNPINLTGWPPSGGGGGGSVNLGVRVSVKDAPYNAVGDGVADDTVAIQSAINAVVAAGGGTVFIPHGIYLCNGAFDATWHSILKIPFGGPAGGPVALQIVGEDMPSWSASGATRNFLYSSTIKTTRTDGMTVDSSGFAAIIAGQQPFGNGLHATYSDMNSVMTRIKNLQFLCPDNPTMGGIRLDGIGNAFVENVLVNTATDLVQPTHGTTAVWMPNSINWSINWALHVSVAGFDTGFKTGEHLRAPMIQVFNCLNGVTFLESIYPSWANIQLGNVAEGIVFLGYHTVDLIVETEHGNSSWFLPSHDIKDASNKGTGTIRVMVGQGGGGAVTNAPSLLGGTGLTVVDMYSGNVTLNSAYGAAGGAASFIGALSGNVNTNQLYIGTDARLIPVSGGVKLETRNTGTNTWLESARWTNP